MRYTLLEITQLILSSMSSDEVNSITDTTEAYDIAKIVKSVYYDSASELRLTEHQTLFQLEASGDDALPTLMTVPSNIIKVDSIKYDYKEDGDTYSEFKKIKWIDFDTFIRRGQALREDTTGVGSMDVIYNTDETFEVLFQTDRHPQFYTNVDDTTILFDAYKSTLDTTLQNSKTMCYGLLYPEFNLEDNFTPTLDPSGFSYLINKAKARCFTEIKQVDNPNAVRETRQQKISLIRNNDRIRDTDAVYKHKSRFGRK